MPVSMPGWPAYVPFSPQSSPEEDDIWFDAADYVQTDLEENWFDAKDFPPQYVSLSEDCLRSIRGIISHYAELKQNELIFTGLIKLLPGFPVNLLSCAHSIYLAIIHNQSIDIAVLNTLGLASDSIFAEGNVISTLAKCIQDALIYYIGEDYLNHFLGDGEGYLFTSLAVLSIAMKYWLKEGPAAQRTLLRIPVFLAGLLIRANYYWHQLGHMAQHAVETCRMTVPGSGESYLCVKNTVTREARQDWICEKGGKHTNTPPACSFVLSAEGLQQMQDQGVMFWRQDSAEPLPTASTGRKNLPLPIAASVASLIPLAATRRWQNTADAMIGTAIGATLLYAWYSMFAKSPAKAVSGSLSEDEKVILKEMTDSLWAEKKTQKKEAPVFPFTLAQRAALERGIQQIWQTLQVSSRREKREISHDDKATHSTARSVYWAKKLARTPQQSPEYAPLSQLVSGTRLNGSFIAAKESFPALDSHFTLMDQLNPAAFCDSNFIAILHDITREIAQSDIANFPDGRLPGSKWLHLGLFWQALYTRLLAEWGTMIVRLNTALASEYKIAVEQVDKIINQLQSQHEFDFTLPLFTTQATLQREEKVTLLANLHNILLNFNNQQRRRLTEVIKIEEWMFNKTHIGKKWAVTQYNYDLTAWLHLDKLDLSKFTTDFYFELRELINSLLSLLSTDLADGEVFEPTKFYAELCIIALRRLLSALMDDNPVRAYNYAMLDEMVIEIVMSNITCQWEKTSLERFMMAYFASRDNIWPEYEKMSDRLHQRQPHKKVSIPAMTGTLATMTENLTIAPVPAIFSNISMTNVIAYVNDRTNEAIPQQRQSMEQMLTNMLLEKSAEYINKITYIYHSEIFEPAGYLDKWMLEVIKKWGAEDILSPDSIIKVTGYRNLYVRGITAEKIEVAYSLRDIVKGKHLRESFSHFTLWFPQNIDCNLQIELLNNSEHDIKQKVTRVFDSSELLDMYRVMARRAALDYITQKTTLLGKNNKQREYAQNEYIDCVTDFLSGKIKPKLVAWQKEKIPGLIFIPVLDSKKHPTSRGVLLSLWSGGYYDVPYPGFARSAMQSVWEVRPTVSIERDPDFQTFIRKHSVPRVSRAVLKANNPFNYQEKSVTSFLFAPYIQLNAPFDLLVTDDYIKGIIALHRSDLLELYDEFIESNPEHIRAELFELFNVLSITAGIVLTGAGIVIGGPAWAYIAASIAATLLLDVAPAAVLYQHADDDNERQLYLYSMLAAIAMESITSVPTLAMGKAIRGISFKLMHQGLLNTYDTVQPLVTMVEKALKRAADHFQVERLRMIAGRVHLLDKLARSELDDVMVQFNRHRARTRLYKKQREGKQSNIKTAGETGIAGANSAHVPAGNTEAAPRTMLSEIENWTELGAHFSLLGYSPWYRAILRWDPAVPGQVNMEYMGVVRCRDDVIVITELQQPDDIALLYRAEPDWAQNIRDVAEKNNHLVKYIDFTDFDFFAINYKELAGLTAQYPEGRYINGAKTLFAPHSYKEAIKLRTGLEYDDIQYMLNKIRHMDKIKTKTGTNASSALKKTEPIRKVVSNNNNALLLTKDFDTAEFLRAFKSRDGIKHLLSSTRENGRRLILPLNTFILGRGFSDTRIRRMLMWKNASTPPSSHFMIVGKKEGIEYIFDLAAPKLMKKIATFTTPVIMREVDWVAKCREGIKNILLKYKDFNNDRAATKLFPHASARADDFIDDAVILHIPAWYLALKNVAVEKITRLPDPPMPLSKKLQQHVPNTIESSIWASASNIKLKDEPVLVDKDLAERVAAITNVGPDITHFYPIAAHVGLRNNIAKTYIYTKSIAKDLKHVSVAKNLLHYRAMVRHDPALIKVCDDVAAAFTGAHAMMEKMKALMSGIRDNPVVMERVISRLAIFLNEKNIDILEQSFLRLEEIVERTWEIADYHVVKTKLDRVIPQRIRPESSSITCAHVFPGDPYARIMIVLDNFRSLDLIDSVLHEMTHSSVNSVDFAYLANVVTLTETGGTEVGVKTIAQAHNVYGRNLFATEGLQYALGKGQVSVDYHASEDIASMSLSEQLVAQARIQRLPMLRANTKMNNADSLVVLIRDLLGNFDISRDSQSAWKVSVINHNAAGRSKRSVDDDKKVQAIFLEEILSTFILHAGYLKVDDIITAW